MNHLKTWSMITMIATTIAFASPSMAQTPLPDQKISLHQKSVMDVSVDAPEGVEGTANLHLKYVDVTTEDPTDESSFEKLVLKLKGLPQGTYNVFSTLSSTNETVLLGSFEVATTNTTDAVEVGFGTEQTNAFPAEVNPWELEVVTVEDSLGTELLSVDLTDLDAAFVHQYKVNVQLQPGSTLPTARGRLHLMNLKNRGTDKDRMHLNAHGLTPSTTYNIYINGNLVGTENSRHNGRIHVKKVPNGVDVLEVSSLEIRDDLDNVILSTTF